MSTTLFWIVIAALTIMEGLIVFSALRMRVAPGPAGSTVGGRRMEVLWTLLPALLLLAMAVLSFQALDDDDSVDNRQVSSASATLKASLTHFETEAFLETEEGRA